jgi:hypothetical protein
MNMGEYSISIRGQIVHISESQIRFDPSPSNKLSKHYLSDPESSNPQAKVDILSLDSHPQVFQLILDWLSGYPIFPLSRWRCENIVGLSIEEVERFVLKDARDLGLKRLVDELSTFTSNVSDNSREGSVSRFKFF